MIQHETGGNLVEILEKIASTIRARYQFFGRLRTLTAEAKLSGIVLACLPFVAFALIYLFRPTYLRPLFTDLLGFAILGAGATLWILGGLWMRKLARVDF